jgi:hypothetical protein
LHPGGCDSSTTFLRLVCDSRQEFSFVFDFFVQRSTGSLRRGGNFLCLLANMQVIAIIAGCGAAATRI